MLTLIYSVLSTVSIQYTETTIAAACIYLAILGLKPIPLETAMPTLLTCCDVSEGILLSMVCGIFFIVVDCANCIKSLYPSFEKLFLQNYSVFYEQSFL